MSVAGRVHRLGLQVEQLVLDLGAAEVGAELSVGADDPVAGDDERQGVGGARGADGPHRLRVVHRGSHGLVAGGLPVADGRKVGQHRAAEPGREAEVERQVEAGAAPGEVLLELAGGLVEPPRGAQDPGADLAGQASEHRVEALAFVGDPDQPGRGGGQQQRADRRVEGAVGDVEQALVLGLGDEPGVQRGQLVLGRGRAEQLGGVVVGSFDGHGHYTVPSSLVSWSSGRPGFRSLAIPSAAARRAASGLPPITAATSA